MRLLLLTTLLAAPLTAQNVDSLFRRPERGTVAAPTRAEIQAAIDRGRLARDCTPPLMQTPYYESSTGFFVEISGPLQRVECAAAEAAKRYKPFSVDSVTPAMAAPEIHVLALPNKPSLLKAGGYETTPNAIHLIARMDDPIAPPIQPDSVEMVPVQWQTGHGVLLESRGIQAVFRSQLRPRSFLNVVVVTGEREYLIRFDGVRLTQIR